MNLLTVNLIFSTLVFWLAARIYVPRAQSVIVFCFALLAGAYVTLQRHSGVTTLPEELKPPGNIFSLEKISFSWTH